MDTSPGVLLWGYSDEEKTEVDGFLGSLGVFRSIAIDVGQSELTPYEILCGEDGGEEGYLNTEKVMLFFNVKPETIRSVMMQGTSLPKPIYAMITEQTINWKLSYLIDHLVAERDFFERKKKEKMEKSS